MSKRSQRVIEYQEMFEYTLKRLSEEYDQELTSEDLSSFLMHYFWDRDVVSSVHEYIILHPIPLSKIPLILEQEIACHLATVYSEIEGFRHLIEDEIEKARVRQNGIRWDVHKNDADPFPSIPHAHAYQLNVKLHLGTGEMFRGKKLVGKMPRKEFRELKKRLEQNGVTFPRENGQV